MDKKKLLLNQLNEYSLSGVYPFHMPGHKRNISKYLNPFQIDITEIDGFDNLHHPEGILKESMEWAASVYGADRTWYLVNGSSCGILSAVCASVKANGRLLMGRNCHKAVYHGVILNQLETSYVYPQIIRELGIQGGISPDHVENQLQKYQNTAAVLIVSPTYDGVVSNIEKIAEVVHKRNIPLIVDEAHGAHFPFSKGSYFPKPALDCGADIVIQSLHKTLPSLTQTAVIHANTGYADIERLERYLQIFQSSSPSYVFMASIESCIFEMGQYGSNYMRSFWERLQRLREGLSGMKRIQLLDRRECGKYGVFDVDESKLVVSVRGCVRKNEKNELVLADGVWLSDQLRRKYHLEMEMAGVDYVVAILTCCDTDEGIGRLESALLELDGELEKIDQNDGNNSIGDWPDSDCVTTVADALNGSWEEDLIEKCEGRVSAEFIYLYPPGIPIVAPGEVVTRKIIEQVQLYKKMHLPVQGTADSQANRLRVIKT